MQAKTLRVSEALDGLVNHGTLVGLGDSELLSRFRDSADSRAFATLVERHAALVLGVCRSHLSDPNDIEDAFQGTFVALLQGSDAIREPGRLPAWLHRVSRRIALRLKRQRRAVAIGVDLAAADNECTVDERERHGILHLEIDRLPEKHRLPIVLCYLEGLTHDEAAARLGWPVGTVRGRLSRARDQLRQRLERRDVTGAVGFADVLETMRNSQQAIPEASIRSTAALLGDDVPPKLAALSQGAIQAMITERMRRTLVVSLGLMLTLAAGGVTARGLARQDLQEAGGVQKPELTTPTRKEEQQATPRPSRSEGPKTKDDRLLEREVAEDRLDSKKAEVEMLELEAEILRERYRALSMQLQNFTISPGTRPGFRDREKMQDALREATNRLRSGIDETYEQLRKSSPQLARLKREIARDSVALGITSVETAVPRAIDQRLRALEGKVDRILDLLEKGQR